MVLWSVTLLVAALNLRAAQSCPGDCPEAKDYFGWAVGLLVTILIWRLHTTVNNGLLQLWRYSKGGDPFKPPAAKKPVVAEEPQTP